MERDHPGPGPALKAKAAAVVGVLWVLFVLLIVRLAQLQIADAELYSRHASRQQILRRELSARRGRIYDREGRLLAASVQRYSVFADPKGVEHPRLTALLLADLFGLSADQLEGKLHKDCFFVWVKRQITDEQAEQVRRLRLPGVHMRRESKRLYPQGRLATHVVGFTDIDGRGLAGVERKMDTLIRGLSGMETVLCDGGRRVFSSPQDRLTRKPFNGLDIRLTLDAYVQEIAEQELAEAVQTHRPERGAAIVLDARDCSVLAAASWPTFDPAAPAEAPVSHQRNIVVSDAYEFGSVMKPFGIAVALEEGVVAPDTEFDCHQGEWHIGARVLHDAHAYGTLTVSDILCHSSNIGAAQVSLLLGAEKLYAGIRAFGFGDPTGISLPGEVRGIVRPLRAWNRYSVVSVAFGQELAATPLAVASAFAVFPNSGFLLQPRIIQSVQRPGTGEKVYACTEPIIAGEPVSPQVAHQVMRMMRRVVVEGTGRRAQLEAYPVAGKTGTAQLLDPSGRGYSDVRYLASFVGIAPADRPRLVVLACLKAPSQNGYYGGVAAAPAVRRIIDRTLRYMHVPPAPGTASAPGEST
ncbi:MAG: penicillin-binding protein 2 [Candidatus Brocadiaceae bacterium]|jgi:cell division protein FtsI (penicillin-binding protein 3)